MYFFSNETVTLALLIVTVIVPAASLGLLRLSGRNISIGLRGREQTAEKHTFTLTMNNPDIIPVAAADIEVRCSNKRTGELDSYRISRSLPPRGNCETVLDVVPGHAGRYEISAVASPLISHPILATFCLNISANNELAIVSLLILKILLPIIGCLIDFEKRKSKYTKYLLI